MCYVCPASRLGWRDQSLYIKKRGLEARAAPEKVAGLRTGSGQTGFSRRAINPSHVARLCFVLSAHMLPHFLTFSHES